VLVRVAANRGFRNYSGPRLGNISYPITDAEIEELLAELKRLRKLDQVTKHCWCRHCRELRDRANRLPDPPVVRPPLIKVP